MTEPIELMNRLKNGEFLSHIEFCILAAHQNGMGASAILACDDLDKLNAQLDEAVKWHEGDDSPRARLEAHKDDADKLRRNFAKYLAEYYKDSPVEVAALCDEQLDRSGALLGYVREEAALLDN